MFVPVYNNVYGIADHMRGWASKDLLNRSNSKESLSHRETSLRLVAHTRLSGKLATVADMFRQPLALNANIRNRHNLPKRSFA